MLLALQNLVNLRASSGAGAANPAGVSAATALGVVSPSGTANITASGVASAAALGTVTVSAGASTSAAGQSTTTSLGTVSESAAGNTTATGLGATTSLGTVTASGGSGGSAGDAFPAGVAAATSLGTVSETADANIASTGVSASTAQGTAVAAAGSTVAVTGFGLASSIGASSANGAAGAVAVGVSATASLGVPTETADGSVAASGVFATTSLGNVTASSGSGTDAFANFETTPILRTNFGTAWADGGRRSRTQLKRIKEGEAYPTPVVAHASVGSPFAVGRITVPYVAPLPPPQAYPAGVCAFSQTGQALASASAETFASCDGISAETGEVCAGGNAGATVSGIALRSAITRCAPSVHVQANTTFDEGCEADVGQVRAYGVQNPTDGEMMYIAQMLLNSQPTLPRSNYVRRSRR
jgi:hypothetical protein